MFFEVPSGVLLGVGSYITPEGLTPLVVVSASAAPDLKEGAMPVPFSELPEKIREVLPGWAAQADVRALVTGPPEPLSGSVCWGDSIRCSSARTRGAVGPSVEWTATDGSRKEGFLTAGHVTPNGRGTVVESVTIRRLRPSTYQNIGTVTFFDDPINHPGIATYDVAVVDTSSTSVSITAANHHGVATIQAPLQAPLEASMLGAVSGMVPKVALEGALLVMGDRSTRLWKNCWIMVPSAAAAQGDSGATVLVNSTAEIAGIVVGGSRFQASPTYMVQYVQSMETLEADWLVPNRVDVL